MLLCCVFFFQAEDGIRDAQESRGLGDVYKRQTPNGVRSFSDQALGPNETHNYTIFTIYPDEGNYTCLLYTSDAADDLLCVDLGGRRIIKKKKHYTTQAMSLLNTFTSLTYQHTFPTTLSITQPH